MFLTISPLFAQRQSAVYQNMEQKDCYPEINSHIAHKTLRIKKTKR